MAEDFNTPHIHSVEQLIFDELMHVRRLGMNEDLSYASANLGAWEALLIIAQAGEQGVPVYQAVSKVQTPFSGPAGIINRLKVMRKLGLLEHKEGEKKSQVCLVASERLIGDLSEVLAGRCNRTRLE
jgi:hypothetical protein